MENVMKKYKFSIDLYKCDISILIGSLDEWNEKLEEWGFPKDNCFTRGVAVLAIDFVKDVPTKNFCIWMPEVPNGIVGVGELVHEITHMAMIIAEDRGIVIDCDNSEPITYMVQHMTEKILKLLKIKVGD
jgi:hypothetical protein